ncbi:hypothetical protein [Brevibacillus laterosporus]|uniref:hypothetical protein n=1 Tax=Brevibacillus laterosporus TaxID=1465 RepID=UPI003D24CB1D
MFGLGKKESPQDMMDGLFAPSPSEMTETLTLMKDFGVTFSEDQIKAIAILHWHGGFEWLIDFLYKARAMRLPTNHYMTIIKEMAKAQAASNNPQMVGVIEGKKK